MIGGAHTLYVNPNEEWTGLLFADGHTHADAPAILVSADTTGDGARELILGMPGAFGDEVVGGGLYIWSGDLSGTHDLAGADVVVRGEEELGFGSAVRNLST